MLTKVTAHVQTRPFGNYCSSLWRWQNARWHHCGLYNQKERAHPMHIGRVRGTMAPAVQAVVERERP